jgi:hypothetical protein
MPGLRNLLAATLVAACVLPALAGCKDKHEPVKPTVTTPAAPGQR